MPAQDFNDLLGQVYPQSEYGDMKPMSASVSDLPEAIDKKTLSKAEPRIAELAKRQDDVSELLYKKATQPDPAPPEPPKPPVFLAPENHSPVDTFKQLGPMLAIWGGLLTRKPMVSAMNSFAAGAKALQQGDNDAYDKHYKEWQDQTKYAYDLAKYNLDVYKDKIENKKASAAELSSYLGTFFKQTQNALGLAAIQNGNISQAMEIYGHVKKATAGVGSALPSLSPDDVNYWADQYAKTGQLPPLGRGDLTKNPDKAAIMHAVAVRHPDLDPIKVKRDLAEGTSEGRAIGTRTVPVELAIKEMDTLAQPMVDAFTKLDPTKYPNINAVRNAVKQGVGDPQVVKANAAMQAYLTAYQGLLTKNGVPTDQVRSKVNELLSRNFSLDQIKGFVDQSKIEAGAVMDAIDNLKSETSTNTSPREEKIIGGVKYYKKDGDWYAE